MDHTDPFQRQPSQTTQFISQFAQNIQQTFIQFGRKCRSYIQAQQQLGINVAPLQIPPKVISYSAPVRIPPPVTYQPPINKKPINDTFQRQSKPKMKEVIQRSRQEVQDPPFIAKRPRNAYNLFVQSQSVKIKEQFPHMRAPDIVRVAAERYNSMNEEQKRPYMQKFEQAKRIFDRQVQQMGGRMPVKRRRGKAHRNDYSLKQ